MDGGGPGSAGPRPLRVRRRHVSTVVPGRDHAIHVHAFVPHTSTTSQASRAPQRGFLREFACWREYEPMWRERESAGASGWSNVCAVAVWERFVGQEGGDGLELGRPEAGVDVCMYVCGCMRVGAYVIYLMYMRTCIQKRARTHTREHTHTHTRAHIHTPVLLFSGSSRHRSCMRSMLTHTHTYRCFSYLEAHVTAPAYVPCSPP